MTRHAPLLAGLAALVLVFAYAWVCDDAFITFRVVDQVLAGNGPVFNAGERVQAFTHPLWFLLLLVGGAAGANLYAWAILLGLGCSFATFWLLGRVLPPRVLLLVSAVLLTSPSFLEFQTSGLENPLTHLLLAAMLFAHVRGGDVALVSLAGLLLLNRLDLAPLVAPVVLLVALRRPAALLGLAPLLAWLAFATLYYGSPLPNTAYAKVAFTLPQGLAHGVAYLADFVTHEPLQALALVGALPVLARSHRAVAVGVVLQLLSVTLVGGDFMRGRMLLAPLFAAVTTAGLALPAAIPAVALAGTVLVLLLGLQSTLPFLAIPTITPSGITRERAQYPTLWLGHYAGDGFEEGRGVVGTRLRRYAERYGPVTVSADVLGVFGYTAGPQVTVLDRFTLADAFLARLDPVQRPLRAGHIRRHIPAEYFVLRGDVAQLPNWESRVAEFDPSVRADALAAAATARWRDPGAQALYEHVREVTAGPLLGAGRLGQLVAFASPKSWRRELGRVERAESGGLRVYADFVPGFGDFRVLLEGPDTEGAAWDDPQHAVGVPKPGDAVLLDLGSVRPVQGVTLTADANDVYRIRFSEDGRRFDEGVLLRQEAGVGLQRRSAEVGKPARYLKLDVLGGDGFYSLGRLEIR